ncbi:adenosylcobinamide-phosphate synthase CbiB [Teredinibacter turnerae]|uniref:adenosylcobinamide-phosphate synthase CbiB n=1 Tax=Teredinibacter turnerae TaxID=2426 RepID=UPI00040A201B|nr:adenosylcobinamide-phosphate synthase CbiB [Teredinibacter turnerae]
MVSLAILLLAWWLDTRLGEPTRFHPLVGFGNYAAWLERHLRRLPLSARWQGIIALLLATLPIVPFAFAAGIFSGWFYVVLGSLVVYLAMAYRALREHALHVYRALEAEDLPLARLEIAKIVSRETAELSEGEVCTACIESVLENGSDAIFSAWFWWLLLGLPGVVLYRLVNTLDAMWGYKNTRYRYFGWAAARADDVMNYLPARSVAWCYSLAGNAKQGLRCWREQGHRWKSPNAGPVMAAGAGSLTITLGGAARYHGVMQTRMTLGVGATPVAQDILRALHLVRLALWIWLAHAVVVCGGIFLLFSLNERGFV